MVTERQTVTVGEAAKILGIGRNSAYQAVARGDIPVIRVGKRLLIPRVQIERLLAGEKSTIGANISK
jgi:excisionase family DNA binding protein